MGSVQVRMHAFTRIRIFAGYVLNWIFLFPYFFFLFKRYFRTLGNTNTVFNQRLLRVGALPGLTMPNPKAKKQNRHSLLNH